MENMNHNGNGSAGCEMSARAAEVSPLTTPIDSPPSPAPSPGATTVAATPPVNRPRVLPRRERPRPTFTPTQRAHPPEPNQEPVTETNTEATLPDHTLRVEYEIRVLGGKEDVATIKSRFDLPLALKEESLARTDGDFADVFDKIVVAPLITQVRAHLQGRFDHYAEMKAKQLAAEAALPSPPNGQYKPPKPTNAASFAMPEIDTKPPLPTRPGSRDWAAGKNGA
jgi:hypothetical protein